jgi:glycosyltransferase involved in cell wall biosynthesis
MKIAIASSGLGHVARGIETWAGDTAVALSQLLSCQVVELLRKEPSVSNSTTKQPNNSTTKHNVTLFCAAPLPQPVNCHVVVLPCLKRGDRLTRLITRLAPKWTWRWGWTSVYDLEQRSFWRHLWPILRDGGYDILHVQDPLLADLCRRYRKAGKLKTREILAHGTEEPAAFLKRFPAVQHLTPWHLHETLGTLGQAEGRGAFPLWTALPNFVDCEVFRPARGPAEKIQLRKSFGIPPEAFVVASVAALKCGHKRVDHVIREFKAAAKDDWCLVLAGARTDETATLQALAAGDARIRLMPDIPRTMMQDLHRTADIMVLGSLFEMMPIAVLEALATGLPVLCNNHPVLAWMVGTERENVSREDAKTRKEESGNSAAGGEEFLPLASSRLRVRNELPGGMVIDMSNEGVLAEALGGVTPEWIAEHGKAARARALAMFSRDVVIGQYVEYYNRVLEKESALCFQ